MIDLIELVTVKGELNQSIVEERVRSTVFGDVDSVTQTEFFSGGRLGLQPQLKITIYDFEYHDEPIVQIDQKCYSVYRTYLVPDSDKIELYVEEKGGTKDEPS
jgi:hypothetical protein